MNTIPKEKRVGFKGKADEAFLKKLGVGIEAEFSNLNFDELAKKVVSVKIKEVSGAAIYMWILPQAAEELASRDTE